MQDGQYLFEPSLHSAADPYLSDDLQNRLQQGSRWYGSWQLNAQLDRLSVEQPHAVLIVVGISSAEEDRTNEYSPWAWHGAAIVAGDRYLEFIVQTLKSYIDRNFPNKGFHTGELWFRYISGGRHRLEDWRQRFPEALLWLYR
jgi:alpha-glucosidase